MVADVFVIIQLLFQSMPYVNMNGTPVVPQRWVLTVQWFGGRRPCNHAATSSSSFQVVEGF